jgi:NAD(P)-dependent dehydrogenase (short-subunit alcohol dehydrogenase family)
MSGLRYRIVLITGGSGGLGQALAAAFLREETRVVIAARDHDRLNAAAEKIAQNSTQVLALPCEISQRDQLQRLGEEIKTRWGEVQILINNAGIARAVNFSDMPDALWDETLATNLAGTYNCCKVFLPGVLNGRRHTKRSSTKLTALQQGAEDDCLLPRAHCLPLEKQWILNYLKN